MESIVDPFISIFGLNKNRFVFDRWETDTDHSSTLEYDSKYSYLNASAKADFIFDMSSAPYKSSLADLRKVMMKPEHQLYFNSMSIDPHQLARLDGIKTYFAVSVEWESKVMDMDQPVEIKSISIAFVQNNKKQFDVTYRPLEGQWLYGHLTTASSD